MTQFVNVAIGGLMAGAILALVALGLTLVFRLTRIVNLAQGAIVVVGALVFNSLWKVVPLVVALLGAVLVGAICGLLLERLAIRPAVGKLSEGSLFIVTAGALAAIQGISLLIWGSQPYSLPSFSPTRSWVIGDIRIPTQALWIFLALAVTVGATWIFFTRTTVGIAVRATAEKPDTAAVMGINVSLFRAAAFAVASAVSALAGAVAGPVYSLAFDSGGALTNSGFIAVVLGGLGSVVGGIVGGLAVGLVQQFAAGYVPDISSNTVVLVVLLAVMVLRPQGLLGVRQGRADTVANPPLVTRAAGRLGPRTALITGIALVALVLVLPLGVDSSVLSALVITGVLAIAVLGLDVVMGFAGQISLGHAAFMALGAYTTAVLTTRVGWSLWPAIGAGMVVAALAALLLAMVTVRLSGLYLAMGTLAFGLLIDSLAIGLVSVTGGSAGIAGIPPVTLFGLTLDTGERFYYFVWGLVGVLVFLLWNVANSDFGRTLRSVKADQAAARSIGVRVTRYKVYAFVIGAVLAGLAGGLYASYLQYLSPDVMGIHLSFALVTMLIVGGEATLIGGLVGAALITLLPTQIQALSTYSSLFEGLLLIVILLFLPEGLWGGFVEGLRAAVTRLTPRARRRDVLALQGGLR
ncbi:MAG: branched-chain amino acid transport system / permease component family protein [Blastococcus sp.]|jgi:branched-chain amino acid transport system permease protein|nr:branched-chain amino acid transport system / permease component family protein [Blastococcus sp.]